MKHKETTNVFICGCGGMQMCKVYGYCRISTKKQSIDRQIRNILAECPTAEIRQEIYTGTKFQGREELQKLLRDVKSGDTIIFDSVSRMSRDADNGIKLYLDLFDKNINLVFIKEHYIDTDTYRKSVNESIASTGNEIADIYIEATNKVIKLLAIKQIRQAFEQAEKEVVDLQERTKEGIKTARLDGKKIGGTVTAGKPKVTKKSKDAKKIIQKHSKSFGGSLDNKEIMRLSGISEPTLLKYKKEIRQEMIANGMME